MALFLNSDNLLTVYEQLSYYRFNQSKLINLCFMSKTLIHAREHP